MGSQRTFASMAWNRKGKVTRRERFLGEMDAVIPWSRLVKLIEPHYPKAGQGRQPLGLEKMLRIYFLQQWFNLSDPQAEDAIYDSESMRRFARVELGDEVVPDESTILRFRHLLEQHGLTQAIFDAVADLLEERRLLLRSGTIVDATIIAAPSSTKNATTTRDPEMKQTRKGRNWHFGMKLHVGTDPRGIVHTVRATDAAVADITQLPDLVHGQEREVFGDQAYWSRRFSSRILPPYMRRSPKVAEVLPILYLRGLSTGDFRPALEGLLGERRGRTVTDQYRPPYRRLGARIHGVSPARFGRARIRLRVGRRGAL